ncbi:hypothetical protein OCC_07526 [Thermococcus litoralis DSM 5473]|uniref:Uncharacterized protein n=1 Tax=Thermococcus litoralis (strain ATCC 51850 / DSM 5473 / JCM 8560 / NS-C) TaxID=523849 RepID=H3ZL68_THELN|nr:hypothetical protein [Thermococcus litoralis]EHR79318.1 hypothetical protein OCC_07526 [Thermococcus litoralis DSM 5473]
MRIGEKVAGGVLYALGLILAILRPPMDRAACTVLPGGEVCEAINPFFLTLEVGLVMAGSLFVALGYPFKNARQLNGWLGVASGLGIAFVGGYAGLKGIVIFGAALATLGIILYKLGGLK